MLAADLLPEELWADTNEYRGKAAAAALRPSIYLGLEPGRHRLHRDASFGDGHRHPHDAADGGGGRTDADFSKVKIEQGIGDKNYGDQNTDGSKSIRGFYTAFSGYGRVGAADVAAGGRGAVECAGIGMLGEDARGDAYSFRQNAGLWRAGDGSR